MRTRAVFDCNILVQALAFDTGAAAECLRMVEAGKAELFVSKPTLAELRKVLGYPHIREISPNMTPVRIGAFLERVRFRATLVRKNIKHLMDYPRDRDPLRDFRSLQRWRFRIPVRAGIFLTRQ